MYKITRIVLLSIVSYFSTIYAMEISNIMHCISPCPVFAETQWQFLRHYIGTISPPQKPLVCALLRHFDFECRNLTSDQKLLILKAYFSPRLSLYSECKMQQFINLRILCLDLPPPERSFVLARMPSLPEINWEGT